MMWMWIEKLNCSYTCPISFLNIISFLVDTAHVSHVEMWLIKAGGSTYSRVRPSFSINKHVVRGVSSNPPLTAAFNTKQTTSLVPKFNWFLNKSPQTGLFGVPELKHSDGWSELRDRCYVNCNALVEEVTSEKRYYYLIWNLEVVCDVFKCKYL